jgi:23S rRNA pseudouridine1911/1915/1917 synthase
MMARVRRKVGDKRVLGLIRRFLQAGLVSFFALFIRLGSNESYMQEYVEKVGIADVGLAGWMFSGSSAWMRRAWAEAASKAGSGKGVRGLADGYLMPGQILTLAPDYPDSTIVPHDGPLHVVFADEHLAVIDKCAALTVHPAPSVTEPTLVHRVAHHFPSLLDQSGERPGVVHRLDKDTSGLIVMALSEQARLELTRAFASREVYKEYLALVCGVTESRGVVNLPLGRHPTIKTRMAVVERGGRVAETRFQRIWSAPDKSASLLRVRIMTGRTHQIRVHLAALGHPILGDAVYADKQTAARAPRQMLHAWQLRFEHPRTGEPLDFIAPIPADFLEVLEGLCRERACIGLTGAVGSGKSTVRAVAEESGVPVFCADLVVAESYARDGQGCAILEHHFGARYRLPGGGVDKEMLFAAMSESESLRREVERLIHPLVRHALHAFRAGCDEDVTLAEIPLLCEAGLAGEVDLVAVVFCPDRLRHARLRERDWSPERIALVDSWQLSQTEKVGMAHLVVDNSGSLEQLQSRAGALIGVVRAMLHGRVQRRMADLHDFFENPDTMEDTD